MCLPLVNSRTSPFPWTPVRPRRRQLLVANHEASVWNAHRFLRGRRLGFVIARHVWLERCTDPCAHLKIDGRNHWGFSVSCHVRLERRADSRTHLKIDGADLRRLNAAVIFRSMIDSTYSILLSWPIATPASADRQAISNQSLAEMMLRSSNCANPNWNWRRANPAPTRSPTISTKSSSICP